MIIDRHNYEEFFLLYVDNELTEAERAEVEVFVQQHPDLEKELQLLKESTLLPDTILFTDKISLYKNEHSISLANREDYFIEYVNNELTGQQRDEVEKFVLQHPQLQNEFTLLQKTKLNAEVVSFGDKSSLYRNERRRVIPMGIMRMAVAAAVLGLVTTLWLTFDRKTPADSIAVIKNTKETIPTNHVSKAPLNNTKEANNLKKEVEPESIQKKRSTINLEEIALKESVRKTTPVTTDDNLNRLPVPDKGVLAFIDKKKEVDADKTIQEPLQINGSKEVNTSYATALGDETDETNSITKHAVYNEMDNASEDDKTIFIAGAEINRNKLRGLFKKATNLFDRKIRRTNDDNTVHLASFELKTK